MKFKKVASLLTLAAMLGSSMTAGAAELKTSSLEAEEGAEVTFIYVLSSTFENQDAVSAAIEAACLEDTGITLHVEPMSLNDCFNNISLMIAGGESCDVFPSWANNIASFVDGGYVMDLTEYLSEEAMPNIVEWIGTEDVEACNVDGLVWGVPTNKERCSPQCIEMRQDILDELGINAEDIQTLDDITEVFAAVKEAYPDMVILGGAYNEGLGNASDQAYTMDPLGDELGVLENYGEDNLTVVNEYETDYWKNLVYTAREWYEAGYISKDMATSQDSGSTLMAAGNLFAYCDNYKPNTPAEKKSQTGYDLVYIPLTEPLRSTLSTSGIAYSVSGVTEYPNASVIVLDWLYGSAEANDLMNFGVQDSDWVENEEGTASYPDGMDGNSVGYHMDWGWAIPNQFAGHLWEGNDLDLYDQYQEFKESAHISKAYGFSFNNVNVTDQIIACQAVVSEWVPQLTTGSVDPETGIQEFNDALYSAGLQDIIDEKQALLDAWAEENGVE